MRIRIIGLVVLLALLLAPVGCTPGHRTGEGAAIGAGLGILGGGIAALTGASPWWILGGAAIGAAGGAITGTVLEAHDRRCTADHYQCSHCHAIYCQSPHGCPRCHSQYASLHHHHR